MCFDTVLFLNSLYLVLIKKNTISKNPLKILILFYKINKNLKNLIQTKKIPPVLLNVITLLGQTPFKKEKMWEPVISIPFKWLLEICITLRHTVSLLPIPQGIQIYSEFFQAFQTNPLLYNG